MNLTRQPGDGRRLMGDMLIEAGLLCREGLSEALEEQKLRGGRLGYNLLRLGRVVPASLHLFLGDHLAEMSPDLDEAIRASPPIDLLPAGLAHHYGILPMRAADGTLDLAVSTADRPELVSAVQVLTGLRVEPLVCPPALINDALGRFYGPRVAAGVLHRSAGDNLLVATGPRPDPKPLGPWALRVDAPAAEWARSLAAEAMARGARSMRIEPRGTAWQVMFEGTPHGVDASALAIPAGAYPGVARLFEGLAGIARRGRVVPREGRFTLVAGRRRLRVSVLCLPGLAGDSLRLGIHEAHTLPLADEDLKSELPDLSLALRRMADRRRGLIIIAGPGPDEAAAGARPLLDLLDPRLARRVAVGEWPELEGVRGVDGCMAGDEEEVPLAMRVEAAMAEDPDLLLLPDTTAAQGLPEALSRAGERPVLAALAAADAFEAASWLARSSRGLAFLKEGHLLGILGVRLMESLCRACCRASDLADLLSPGPPHRAPLPGSYYAGTGCDACRGSGTMRFEPVLEFLPGEEIARRLRPGLRAADLRERLVAGGRPTIFRSSLRRAAAGRIDVREPLRFLLDEQR